MRIIAKQGLEFEPLCRDLYEQMMHLRERALQLGEQYLGVKPIKVGYRWAFGYTCDFHYSLFEFPQGSVLPKWFKYVNSQGGYYKLDKRSKEAVRFLEVWEAAIKPLSGKLLIERGIPVLHKPTRIYTWWQPFFEDGKYGVFVPSSLLDRMEKHDDSPFYIEM